MPPPCKGNMMECGCSSTAATDYLPSSETVSFLRPCALRAASTLRPAAVSMRLRNPCLFFLLRIDG